MISHSYGERWRETKVAVSAVVVGRGKGSEQRQRGRLEKLGDLLIISKYEMQAGREAETR